MRIKRAVRAGRVVAEVGVRWVDRKSVNSSKGSSRIWHLVVKLRNVSTISSKLFW
jgi:hypothetical protein